MSCGILDKSGTKNDHIAFRPDTWSLVHVLRGRGSYAIPAERPIPLAAGDCFLRTPGTAHSTVIDPASGWLEAFIGMGPRLALALRQAGWLRTPAGPWRWGLAQDRVDRFAALRERLRQAGADDLPALAPQFLALAAEAMAAAVPAADVDPLARAAALLDADPPLPPAAAAGRIGMGYEAFRRRFRQRYGLPPAAWARRRRLDRACALLIGSPLPVSGIAARLGYANPFAFTNRFTAAIGVSPRDFRRRGA